MMALVAEQVGTMPGAIDKYVAAERSRSTTPSNARTNSAYARSVAVLVAMGDEIANAAAKQSAGFHHR